MQCYFQTHDGVGVGPFGGRDLMKRLGLVPDVDALFEEFTNTAVDRRVQVGNFLFFALSRALSTDNAGDVVHGNEAMIYRRQPEAVIALRKEQSIAILPNDDSANQLCLKCGVKAVVTLPARQLRAADESETFFTQCAACGFRVTS